MLEIEPEVRGVRVWVGENLGLRAYIDLFARYSAAPFKNSGFRFRRGSLLKKFADPQNPAAAGLQKSGRP